MSVFQANVQTQTQLPVPVPCDSQVPGIGRGAAKPASIHSDSFLAGDPDLAAAVDQALLHGNGTIVLPQLNETIEGTANLKTKKDRYEQIKGATKSVQLGGVTANYGGSLPAGGAPFTEFAYSSVYEARVYTYNFALQSEHTAGISDAIEFGDRIVHRYDYEIRNVYGAQSNYSYGTNTSQFKGIGSEEIVFGSKHDTYDQVTSFQGVAPINLLIGLGLHLQCRPGMELNYNIWNVVVALSESLVSLVNLDIIVAALAGHPAQYGFSGVRLAADAANVRQTASVPTGTPRIP